MLLLKVGQRTIQAIEGNNRKIKAIDLLKRQQRF